MLFRLSFWEDRPLDITVYFILMAEASMALVLLWFSGVLKKNAHVFLAGALIAAAFILRGSMLNYVTLDYQDFLSVWVNNFRISGGLKGLGQSVGNYNVPYLTILALISQSAVSDLYLIKTVSIFFDQLFYFVNGHTADIHTIDYGTLKEVILKLSGII